MHLQGTCDPRFRLVKEAFAQNFSHHGEVGAAVAVAVDGKLTVDLWGGYSDTARTQAWDRDTIVVVASNTKAITATCAHMLVDRELLDLDAPVARYWPEFAQAGKERILVQHVLRHQAGLPVIDKPMPEDGYLDWTWMIHALEEQRPYWEAGTAMGYHAMTFGFLVGEVIRRITRKTVGTFLRQELAGPLGADFYIGFGPELDERCAEVIREPVSAPSPASQREHTPLAAKVLAPRGQRSLADHASRRYRAAELPSGNGHGNARALARIYGALARGGEVDGIYLMSRRTIEQAMVVVPVPDVVGIPGGPRSLGFVRSSPMSYFGPSPNAFGHSGAGGSFGFADLDARIGFGYTQNFWVNDVFNDPRRRPLIDAVYASLN